MYDIKTRELKHGDNLLVEYMAYRDNGGPYTRKFVDSMISQCAPRCLKCFFKRELTDRGRTSWYGKAGE